MTNSHEAFPSSVDPPSPTVRTDDTGVLYDTDLDPSQVSAAHLQNIVARLPDNILALARYFGNGTLDPKPTSPELVAFTVPPNTVLSYERGLALALALVLVALFIALLVLGLRRYLLRAWGLVVGFGLAWSASGGAHR